MLENANLLEIVWTSTGIVTLLILLIALVFFADRMLVACKKANQVDLQTKLIAIYKFAGVITGITIQVSFILAGVLAIGNPDSDNADAGWMGVAIVILILFSELALAFLAIFDLILIHRSLKEEHVILWDKEKRKIIWTDDERAKYRPQDVEP